MAETIDYMVYEENFLSQELLFEGNYYYDLLKVRYVRYAFINSKLVYKKGNLLPFSIDARQAEWSTIYYNFRDNDSNIIRFLFEHGYHIPIDEFPSFLEFILCDMYIVNALLSRYDVPNNVVFKAERYLYDIETFDIFKGKKSFLRGEVDTCSSIFPIFSQGKNKNEIENLGFEEFLSSVRKNKFEINDIEECIKGKDINERANVWTYLFCELFYAGGIQTYLKTDLANNMDVEPYTFQKLWLDEEYVRVCHVINFIESLAKGDDLMQVNKNEINEIVNRVYNQIACLSISKQQKLSDSEIPTTNSKAPKDKSDSFYTEEIGNDYNIETLNAWLVKASKENFIIHSGDYFNWDPKTNTIKTVALFSYFMMKIANIARHKTSTTHTDEIPSSWIDEKFGTKSITATKSKWHKLNKKPKGYEMIDQFVTKYK